VRAGEDAFCSILDTMRTLRVAKSYISERYRTTVVARKQPRDFHYWERCRKRGLQYARGKENKTEEMAFSKNSRTSRKNCALSPVQMLLKC
jgi:hypothetical protein